MDAFTSMGIGILVFRESICIHKRQYQYCHTGMTHTTGCTSPGPAHNPHHNPPPHSTSVFTGVLLFHGGVVVSRGCCCFTGVLLLVFS